VLEHLGRDHPVEGAVRERQAEGVAVDRGAQDVGRGLAGQPHGGEHGRRVLGVATVAVEGHRVGPPPVGLEGVPAGAAAEVEQPLARPEAHPGEVDGQHE